MGSHEACSPSHYQQRAWVKMPYYFRLQDSVLPPYAHTAFTTVLLGTEGALHLQPHQQGHSEDCGSWLRHLPQGTCSSMTGCAQLVIIKTGTSVKPPRQRKQVKLGDWVGGDRMDLHQSLFQNHSLAPRSSSNHISGMSTYNCSALGFCHTHDWPLVVEEDCFTLLLKMSLHLRLLAYILFPHKCHSLLFEDSTITI